MDDSKKTEDKKPSSSSTTKEKVDEKKPSSTTTKEKEKEKKPDEKVCFKEFKLLVQVSYL